MTKPIRTVAVLGSGVMGGGIAAHLANAGIPVLLLDIVPPKLTDAERASKAARDSIAAGAKDKLKKAKPAAFSHVRNAELIRTGNFDDDLAKVAECDLIVEAIIERLDIKQALFAKLDALLSGETIIASNTSGLRIAEMLEGRSQRFKEHFLVTHFFNPPRYMKLLELVAGPDTSAACKARVTHWGKDQLGKGIVWAKDTPNFVANRIDMMASIHLMRRPRPEAWTTSPACRWGTQGAASAPPTVGLDTARRRQLLPQRTSDSRRCSRQGDGRARHPRRQDQGRLLQARRQGRADARSQDRRVPGQGRRRGDHQGVQGPQQGRGRPRARQEAGRHARRGRRVRVAGAVEEPGLLGAPPGHDRQGGHAEERQCVPCAGLPGVRRSHRTRRERA
jgi:hypothetical protein